MLHFPSVTTTGPDRLTRAQQLLTEAITLIDAYQAPDADDMDQDAAIGHIDEAKTILAHRIDRDMPK